MSYSLPSPLSIGDIAAIADGAEVRVDPEARARIARFYESANSISEVQPVYGRSTGVGANRLTSALADPATHGMNLLRSHAVDAGPAVEASETRAMLAVRLNQLLQPGSGIDVTLIDGLESMLNLNALPEIRQYGGIGTADLPALAGTALAMAGERPTSDRRFEPIGAIRSDSALPFMSSSALTIGAAALTAARLQTLLHTSVAALALSVLGSRANPEAFSAEAAEAIGAPGTARVSEQVRALLGTTSWQPLRLQDPFAYRGFLPAFGVITTAVDRLREAVETLTSSAQENPRFFDSSERVVHHGAFLEYWLAHELDSTAIALTQVSTQSLARVRFLNDETVSKLPRFLAPKLGGSSGTMIVEYVAASALGDVFTASAPVSTHSAVLSCGVEEDATFATSALTKLKQATAAFEILVACEIVTAVRAVRMLETAASDLSPGIAALLDAAERLPRDLEDRDLREDIEIARELIDQFARLAGDNAVTPAKP